MSTELERLIAYRQTADEADAQAKVIEAAAQRLKWARQEGTPLALFFAGSGDGFALVALRPEEAALTEAAADVLPDLYRIAELRLQAEARAFRMRARTLRQLIDAHILKIEDAAP